MYLSSFVRGEEADLSVRAVSYDGLSLDFELALVNVCAEGVELEVLKDMRKFVEACRPVMVVENRSPETAAWLVAAGYQVTSIEGSPSVLATTSKDPA